MNGDVHSLLWQFLWAAIGLGLAAITLPGTIELLWLTLGGILPRAPLGGRRTEAGASLRIAVVVPAHNEAGGIGRCVRSLLESEPKGSSLSVVVVADNCMDDTALAARGAGARVLMRNDPDRRGKGYALDFAFQQLLSEGYEAFIVVDADTLVEKNFIPEFRRRFSAGAQALQCRYVVNNADDSTRTRLMSIALQAFNVLRPRGRSRWGLSAGLFGNGFGLSRETLQLVPYTAVSVVEDLEYHLRLLRAGRTVEFVDSTTVKADMPTGGKGSQTQRSRWEGGRLQMMIRWAPVLSVDLLRGRFWAIEPLLDLLLFPLAFHVSLLLLATVAPFGPTRLYSVLALGIVILHIAAAIRVGGGGRKQVLSLFYAPFYILWKVTLVPAIVRTASRNAEWIRTERAGILLEGGEKR